jgi:hypothetical protein
MSKPIAGSGSPRRRSNDVPGFAELERLTQAPVQSIVDVRYLDANGVEQVLDAAVYESGNVDADVLRPRIRLAFGKSWPAARSRRRRPGQRDVGYTVAPKPGHPGDAAADQPMVRQPNLIAVDVRGVPTELAHSVTAARQFRR